MVEKLEVSLIFNKFYTADGFEWLEKIERGLARQMIIGLKFKLVIFSVL